MAEPTQSPLSGAAPPSPPSHPPPPPASIAAHAARRAPVRSVNGTSGWFAWHGEDLPRRGGAHGGDRGGPTINTRDVTNEREIRDQVEGERRDAPGQGFLGWFGKFKGANFTRPSPAGVPHVNIDNLQDRSGHAAIQPEATLPDSMDSSSVITRIMRREQNAAAVRRAAVAARVAAMVFSLVAFSILAADRNKGWALDSYNNYSQFRYCETVNVIAFVYSGFQLYALLHHKRMEKHIIRRPLGDYFDFLMDQILAYLLISASSSATARVRDWIVNWGNDPFPNMANGSIAVTFMAFLAFAISSLLSAYNLFSKTF